MVPREGRRETPGVDTDVTAFVEAHVRAQTLHIETLSLRLSTERHLWLALEELVRHELRADPRLANALYDAFMGREVGNRYYRDLADVSVATATNDLGLDGAGLLAAVGGGRTRRYVAGPRLMPLVAAMAGVADEVVDPAQPLEDRRDAVLVALAERVRTAGSGGRCLQIWRSISAPVQADRGAPVSRQPAHLR